MGWFGWRLDRVGGRGFDGDGGEDRGVGRRNGVGGKGVRIFGGRGMGEMGKDI